MIIHSTNKRQKNVTTKFLSCFCNLLGSLKCLLKDIQIAGLVVAEFYSATTRMFGTQIKTNIGLPYKFSAYFTAK